MGVLARRPRDVVRTGSLARCSPKVMRVDGAGRQRPSSDHGLAALFERPNRQQTWYEFVETMEAAFLLRGNAYAVKRRNGFAADRREDAAPQKISDVREDQLLIFATTQRVERHRKLGLGHACSVPYEGFAYCSHTIHDLVFMRLVN